MFYHTDFEFITLYYLSCMCFKYSPLEPNIGVFGVRGGPKTAQVFQHTMAWTERDSLLHDQRAFCLVTRLCRNKDFKQVLPSPLILACFNVTPKEQLVVSCERAIAERREVDCEVVELARRGRLGYPTRRCWRDW